MEHLLGLNVGQEKICFFPGIVRDPLYPCFDTLREVPEPVRCVCDHGCRFIDHIRCFTGHMTQGPFGLLGRPSADRFCHK